MGYGVSQLHGLWLGFVLPGPVDKVASFIRLRAGLRVAVDVGKQRAGGAVAQVCNVLAKGLQLVVGKPFGKFIAAYLLLGLSDTFAKLFG